MPEITIDELIAQTEDYYRDPEQYMSRVYLEAIRAILQEHYLRTATDKTQVTVWGHTLDELGEIVRQHHDRSEAPGNTYEVAIIKSFVERVEKRLPDYNTGKGADSWLKAYRVAVMDELAEMEKPISPREPVS